LIFEFPGDPYAKHWWRIFVGSGGVDLAAATWDAWCER